MKKLFISCPMKGRTEENIKKSMDQMHKLAEIIFGEELEVIPSYIEDDPPKDNNQAIWYLGESIKKISEADYYIGISDAYECWNGCYIENEVANRYQIRSFFVSTYDLMPDAVEIARERFKDFMPCPVNAVNVKEENPGEEEV